MRCALKVLALVTLTVAPLGAQMRVDNAELWLTTGQLVGSFAVTNEGQEPIQFTLEHGDWDRGDDGTNRFFAPGSTPSSCERALEVFPRQLRVPAGETQSVRVSLRPDSLPSRACWSIVFVQTEPPQSQRSTSMVRYITRIGVKVYYNPALSVVLAEVEDFRQLTPRAAGDSTAVELAVRNIGTRQVTLNGKVEIRRADNFPVASVVVDPTPILPGAARRIRIALPKLQAGAYVALAIFDYGADEDLAAQTPVVIP